MYAIMNIQFLIIYYHAKNINSNIDIIIGGFDTSHLPNHNFILTKVHSFDSLSWCVSRAKIKPKWQNTYSLVSDSRIPFLIFVGFYITVFLAYFQSIYENWSYDSYSLMLKVLQLCIGNTTNLYAKAAGTRLILIFEFCGSMLFYIYVTSLYIIIIHKSIRHDQIQTQVELIEGGFQLAGDQHALDMILKANAVGIEAILHALFFSFLVNYILSLQFPQSMIKQYRICPNIDDCLALVSYDVRLAVAASYKHSMSRQTISNRVVYCFKEPNHIYVQQISMIMKDTHPLLKDINRMIQKASEGGLIGKWEYDISTRYQWETDHIKGTRKLSFEHIFLAIVVYISFVCFATGAFISEVIIYHFSKRPNACRFWTIASTLIDGDRYFCLDKPLSIYDNSVVNEYPQNRRALVLNPVSQKIIYNGNIFTRGFYNIKFRNI